MYTLPQAITTYIHDHKEDLIDLICTVSSIISPTGQEAHKAHWICQYLHDHGAAEAYIDDGGNVIYPYHVTAPKVLLYNAHMDTVFAQVKEITPIKDGHILRAPSCGDNSADVAALLFIVTMFLQLGITIPGGIYIAFNVGEEGFGNLKGIRHIMKHLKDNLSGVVAVDGAMDEFVNVAVGSRRYGVTVEAAGGHSYGNFGNTNALAISADIIHDLYQLHVPQTPKTTYNIGTLSGGQTVNSIAAHAEFTIDLRSESMTELEKIAATFLAILKRYAQPTVTITPTLLGERPCSDGLAKNPLADRIVAIRKAKGLSTPFFAASTDANIPLHLGIPAIAFSMYRGDGAHTLGEWLDMDSLEEGMTQLLTFMLYSEI